MHAKRPVIIANIPKLPAKWAGIIMPLLLSGLMSGIISMVNMLRALGRRADHTVVPELDDFLGHCLSGGAGGVTAGAPVYRDAGGYAGRTQIAFSPMHQTPDRTPVYSADRHCHSGRYRAGKH